VSWFSLMINELTWNVKWSDEVHGLRYIWISRTCAGMKFIMMLMPWFRYEFDEFIRIWIKWMEIWLWHAVMIILVIKMINCMCKLGRNFGKGTYGDVVFVLLGNVWW
jgi:hypothetical protein